ncbi:hypothetical protein WDU94_008298 [Cyamophila willieti]
MSRSSIKFCIQQYQKARLCFIQTMCSFADKPHTLPLLKEFRIRNLIEPLLTDPTEAIEHAAVSFLAKLICTKETNSRHILATGLMKKVLKHFHRRNNHYKITALHMMGCASPQHAKIDKLIHKHMYGITAGLQDFDLNIRTSTAMALGNIARNNKVLAERIIQVDAVPDLIRMLSSKEPSLKHAAAFALDNLIKTGPELAEAVEESTVIPALVKNLQHDYHKIRSDAFQCLADMARQSPGMANKVATTQVISNTVQHLYYPDKEVQKNAANLLRDLCKHNLRFVDMVVNEGGLDAFLEIIDEEYGSKTLPAIISVGYMAAQSEELSRHIIAVFGITRLREILQNELQDSQEKTDNKQEKQRKNCEEQLQVAAAWTLGQIGKHSVENVTSLSEEKVLLTLFDKTIQPSASDNLKHKCRNALNLLIPKCEDWTVLEVMFLGNDSEELWPSLLCAFSKIIPCDPHARRSFVRSHCLAKMIMIEEKAEYLPYMRKIYDCFPDEVVDLESPNYLKYLMKTLKKFQPPNAVQCPGTPSSESSESLQSDDGAERSMDSVCNAPDKNTKASNAPTETSMKSRKLSSTALRR